MNKTKIAVVKRFGRSQGFWICEPSFEIGQEFQVTIKGQTAIITPKESKSPLCIEKAVSELDGDQNRIPSSGDNFYDDAIQFSQSTNQTPKSTKELDGNTAENLSPQDFSVEAVQSFNPQHSLNDAFTDSMNHASWSTADEVREQFEELRSSINQNSIVGGLANNSKPDPSGIITTNLDRPSQSQPESKNKYKILPTPGIIDRILAKVGL